MKACHKLQFLNNKFIKDSRESDEGEHCAGSPLTLRTDDNLQRIREVLNSGRWLSVYIVADKISIDKMTVYIIITENLVCAKFVSKVLTDNQQQRRVFTCENLLHRIPNNKQHLNKSLTSF